MVDGGTWKVERRSEMENRESGMGDRNSGIEVLLAL